nr:MAG TPA: hypothetical protein [Caudoviricetes sp.]
MSSCVGTSRYYSACYLLLCDFINTLTNMQRY